MRNAFITTLATVAEENPHVWLLCGDLGYSVLEGFAERFPERYVNVGVAEQGMAGIAAGLALSGKTVFIYSIGNFPTFRCLEQIRNDICHHLADVKIVAVGAGFAYGSQGYTHHAVEDIAVMGSLPGIEVFAPCDPAEVRAATRYIAGSRKPAYLRLSRAGEPVLHHTEPVDIRRPNYLLDGSEVVLLASGAVAGACLAAARELRDAGIDAGVASVACLKPFDDAFARRLARNARLLVTVEEHILRGALHAGIAGCLAPMRFRAPVLGLAIPEAAGKASLGGDREALMNAAGLGPGSIAGRILGFLSANE